MIISHLRIVDDPTREILEKFSRKFEILSSKVGGDSHHSDMTSFAFFCPGLSAWPAVWSTFLGAGDSSKRVRA